MATAVKRKLSGSTDGKGITVVATATAGTTIHTAVAGTTAGTFHEIWLWAYNSKSIPVVISVEFGSATLPRLITLPAQSGLVPIIPGLILQNGMVVSVFADTASVVVVDGFVNSITD